MTPETWTATATIVIALFTIVLAIVGSVQTWLTRKAIELGNKEFISTHRPRLRVRQFLAHLYPQMPVKVSFMLVNVGEGNAHIKKSEFNIGIEPSRLTNPAFTRVNADAEPLEIRTIKGGESLLCIAKAIETDYQASWGIANNSGGSLQIRGLIEYTDDNGVDRHTGFLRTYDPGKRRFTRADDPDFEYED